MSTLCPRCTRNRYTPYGEPRSEDDPAPPALSRVDNETYICSPCGNEEAMLDFAGKKLQPPDDWPVWHGSYSTVIA